MTEKKAGTEPTGNVPAPFLIQVNSLEEARVHLITLYEQNLYLMKKVSDFEQRFDTLQTPWPKRIWYKINGWPWYDLNGTQNHRFWHGLKNKIKGDK